MEQMHVKILKDKMNKNWVTVRDKYSQINVHFKWHTFLKKIKKFEPTDGRMDGRTNRRSDYIMPQILFEGIKNCMCKTWKDKIKQLHMKTSKDHEATHWFDRYNIDKIYSALQKFFNKMKKYSNNF